MTSKTIDPFLQDLRGVKHFQGHAYEAPKGEKGKGLAGYDEILSLPLAYRQPNFMHRLPVCVNGKPENIQDKPIANTSQTK